MSPLNDISCLIQMFFFYICHYILLKYFTYHSWSRLLFGWWTLTCISVFCVLYLINHLPQLIRKSSDFLCLQTLCFIFACGLSKACWYKKNVFFCDMNCSRVGCTLSHEHPIRWTSWGRVIAVQLYNSIFSITWSKTRP